jgi:hypothetical protein
MDETFEERIERIDHPGKNGKAELQKLSEIDTARLQLRYDVTRS